MDTALSLHDTPATNVQTGKLEYVQLWLHGESGRIRALATRAWTHLAEADALAVPILSARRRYAS